MTSETIKAKLAALDAEMIAELGLEPGDDWYQAATDDRYAQKRRDRDRLVRDLAAAQSKARVVSPSKRG